VVSGAGEGVESGVGTGDGAGVDEGLSSGVADGLGSADVAGALGSGEGSTAAIRIGASSDAMSRKTWTAASRRTPRLT
jgi:hypothetical protein